jgi:multidrug efflux system membrane fusion protein
MPDDIRDTRATHGTQDSIKEPPPTAAHIGPDHQLPPPKRSTGVRILVWLVILALFALLFWWVITHRAAPATTGRGGGRRGALGGTVNLNVATAKTGNIGVYLDAIGTVTPTYTATIVSQVTGNINEVHYREGQVVHKGELLIQIDPRTFEANVLTAQGNLERDSNLLAQAQMDLKRYQDAWARNAIPKQTLDDQEKIALQYQGTVKADTGTLQFDQTQLAFTHITSPITGRVGLRLVDPGNLATASSTTALAVVTQLQPITVVFTIPEDSVGPLEKQLRQGKALNVDAYDRSETTKLAAGKLEATDNQIDTTTGTLKLRATFANKDNALFPNLFVNARLLLNTLENVVLIPSSAIQHNGDQTYVYLIENETAHIHNIKPGVTEANQTQIIQGLNDGDVLADSSFEKLQDGSKITVSKTQILPANNESDAP